jgi:adenylosuccinate lyase
MIRRYSRAVMRDIWEEQNKLSIWLKIEILASEAQCELGIVPRKDLEIIKARAAFTVAECHEIEKVTNHDVIAFLTCVANHIQDPASRWVHQGMTSSDVLDTCIAVQMQQAADILIDDVKKLRETVAKRAKEHKLTPMIGRSHGIHAEPITFGLKVALMYDEFGRALERLQRAREIISVGKISGAVGTHAHLDPFVEKYVCEKLGLKPAKISTQILQRDRHAEYLNHLAVVACSIERWATEIRHLQRTEVLEAEEFFAAGQKGSSAMPHKRNPITCERLAGLARVIRGNAVAAMENVALWHERDITHSSVERIILPDSTTLLDYMLVTLDKVMAQLLVYPERMAQNLANSAGLIHSQSVLLKLTQKGVSREDSYGIVQRNAMKTWETVRSSKTYPTGDEFKHTLLADPEVAKHLTKKEIEELFDIQRHVRDVDRTFKLVGLG